MVPSSMKTKNSDSLQRCHEYLSVNKSRKSVKQLKVHLYSIFNRIILYWIRHQVIICVDHTMVYKWIVCWCSVVSPKCPSSTDHQWLTDCMHFHKLSSWHSKLIEYCVSKVLIICLFQQIIELHGDSFKRKKKRENYYRQINFAAILHL